MAQGWPRASTRPAGRPRSACTGRCVKSTVQLARDVLGPHAVTIRASARRLRCRRRVTVEIMENGPSRDEDSVSGSRGPARRATPGSGRCRRYLSPCDRSSTSTRTPRRQALHVSTSPRRSARLHGSVDRPQATEGERQPTHRQASQAPAAGRTIAAERQARDAQQRGPALCARTGIARG